MDAQVLLNAVDISSNVISINRNHNYCSNSQEFTIILPITFATTINPSDSIVIYEEGVKVLTGLVGSVKKEAPTATLTIEGRDIYKRALDFFVYDVQTTDVNQRVEYWIENLLNLCGLTASYPEAPGPFVLPDQEIGLDTVANIINYLAQYAGWYCKVDGNGDISFEKIERSAATERIRSGIDILSIERNASYDKTRNKVLVFGGVDESFGQFHQIFAREYINLDFLPVDQTVVFANPYIGTQESAEDFAEKLLDEFSRETLTKNVEIIGNPNIRVGEFINVTSDIFTGTALVSVLQSDFSEEGYIMRLILDDLCPRLAAAIDRLQTDIYAGTWGAGVYYYSFASEVWASMNTGLTNLYVNDLAVDDGYFITATPSGIYTRVGANNWEKQTLSINGYPQYGGKLLYPAVYADATNDCVYALVTFSGAQYTSHYSWLYSGIYNPLTELFTWSGQPITFSGDVHTDGRHYFGKDLEGYEFEKLAVLEEHHGGTAYVWGYINSPSDTYGVYTVKNILTDPTTGLLKETPNINQSSIIKVSPDDRYYAFVGFTNPPPQTVLYIFPTNGADGITVFDAAWDAFSITNALSWSSDSTQLLINVSVGGVRKFCIVNVNGTIAGYVPTINVSSSDVAWSPHNTNQFVFVNDNTADLYLADFQGNTTLLFNGTNSDYPYDPRFFKTKNSFFLSRDQTSSLICAFSLDTMAFDPAIFFTRSGFTVFDDTASELNAFEYVYRRSASAGAIREVNVGSLMCREGEATNKATAGTLDDTPGCWHPDGTKILYIQRDSGPIYYLKTVSGFPDNTRVTLLDSVTLGVPITVPRYSPSAEKILFQGDNEGQANWASIWICDEDGGNAYRAISYSEVETYLNQYLDANVSSLQSGGSEWVNDEELVISLTVSRVATTAYIGVILKFNRDTEELTLLAPSFSQLNSDYYNTYLFSKDAIYSTGDYLLILHQEHNPIASSDITKAYIERISATQNYSYNILVQETNTAFAEFLGFPIISPDGTLFAYSYLQKAYVGNEDGTNIVQQATGSATIVQAQAFRCDSNAVIFTTSGPAAYTYITCRGSSILSAATSHTLGAGSSFAFFLPHPKARGVYAAKVSGTDIRITCFHIKLANIYSSSNSDLSLVSAANDILSYNTDNSDFEIIYDEKTFSEVNLDFPDVIAVYGKRDGVIFSQDFYTTNTVLAGPRYTYDMTMQEFDGTSYMYMTTSSGIYTYDFTASGISFTSSGIGTEILANDENIYFSVLDDAKQSLDNLTTYSDISTGLSTKTITVLRGATI